MIDVITVVHNSSHVFNRFLLGLQNGGYPNFRLTVVNNLSSEKEEVAMKDTLLARQVEHVWLDSGYNEPVHPPKASPDPKTDPYGYSLNFGLRTLTNSHYVLIMNPDCFGDKEEGWMHNALRWYQTKEPDIGIMGALLFHHWGTINHAGGAAPGTHIGRHFKDVGQFDKMRVVPWVTGAFHFSRLEVLKKAGFYLGGHPWCSDSQTCFNCREAGYLSYCAPVKLIHAEHESSCRRTYELNKMTEAR